MKDSHDFLDKLRGKWNLTGEMGKIELHQEVSARWVLGHQYISLYCKSIADDENPTADYEALYHIGYNPDEDLFIFHLLDTTGVPIVCNVGLGRRDGNHIPFVFEYQDGNFINDLTWHPAERRWTFRQEYQENGKLRLFAEKVMQKAT